MYHTGGKLTLILLYFSVFERLSDFFVKLSFRTLCVSQYYDLICFWFICSIVLQGYNSTVVLYEYIQKFEKYPQLNDFSKLNHNSTVWLVNLNESSFIGFFLSYKNNIFFWSFTVNNSIAQLRTNINTYKTRLS